MSYAKVTDQPSQVVYFRNPSERTSMKEHLAKKRKEKKEHLATHGNKHKIQVHTTKRNKQQQKRKRKRKRN